MLSYSLSFQILILLFLQAHNVLGAPAYFKANDSSSDGLTELPGYAQELSKRTTTTSRYLESDLIVVGQYVFNKVSIGTPGHSVVMMLDTGSCDSWVPSIFGMGAKYTPSTDGLTLVTNSVGKFLSSMINKRGLFSGLLSGTGSTNTVLEASQTGTVAYSLVLSNLRNSTLQGSKSSDIYSWNPTLSSTKSNLSEIMDEFYGSGENINWALGDWFSDTVKLDQGTSIKKADFGWAYTSSTFGIFGAGVDKWTSHETWIGSLKSQGTIGKNSIGVFRNNAAYVTGETQGRVLFGGVDTKKFSGDMVIHQAIADSEKYQLMLTISSMKYGKDVVSISTKETFIDTGMPFINVPVGTKFVGLTYNAELNKYLGPCLATIEAAEAEAAENSKKASTTEKEEAEEETEKAAENGYGADLIITVGTQSIIVPYSMLVTTTGYGDYCVTKLMGGEDFVLGAPFLSAAYVYYDYELDTIGLAQSSTISSALKVGSVSESNVVVPGGAGSVIAGKGPVMITSSTFTVATATATGTSSESSSASETDSATATDSVTTTGSATGTVADDSAATATTKATNSANKELEDGAIEIAGAAGAVDAAGAIKKASSGVTITSATATAQATEVATSVKIDTTEAVGSVHINTPTVSVHINTPTVESVHIDTPTTTHKSTKTKSKSNLEEEEEEHGL
ncbi:hypothetical protein DASC09_006050 [Saccharomycopsis crataegensis]|uniref:Peptidase A1 domain-containing protein n=1 Tax=Saccharomycopsis crataegensis TaxID=43959 RepID=A0AAV5QEA2_9ASCO|nr:hypothetical protein DASC09_006050 [Saccharomycopsis crataegensis]